MEWSEAQARTAAHWRRILDGIGRRSPVTVVIEINELSALCEKAREEAGDDAERCAHCIVFADARSCTNARLQITTALLDGDLDDAREATRAIVALINEARPSPLV